MATPESMRESATMLRAAAARMIRDAEELERLAGDRCGKPDPEGRPCTLAAGHAYQDDHSGEVRTLPRPIGRISPETEAFVRHLHGGDAEDVPTVCRCGVRREAHGFTDEPAQAKVGLADPETPWAPGFNGPRALVRPSPTG